MTRVAEPARPPSPAVNPDALRIVLFGMPDAGKSSLLGALAQAAQTQERQLQGRLSDLGFGLADLQRRVYDEKARETLQEIVPYPVGYEPFSGAKPDPSRRIDAVLYDCDGRVANQILTEQKSIEDPSSGELARALRNADALVLVVDASATDEQTAADFTEFVRFLRLLEDSRSERSEVGGLPVFLVLSKCDLLIKAGESAAVWNKRIEERRREVEGRFKDFLESDQNSDSLFGFGSIDLDVDATAVRKPAFQGGSSARDPVGVADLFRKVFAAARDYRQRHVSSRRRLVGIAVGAAGFLALLAAGAAGLYLTRENIQSVPLASTVESYRARENPTPSTRLTEPLQRKIGELTDIQRNPEFEKLPAEQKEFVNGRLRELTAYQEYKARLERERPPAEMRSPEEVNRLEARLQEQLGPPAEFAAEWRQTEAELLRQKWLEDIKAMREAVTDLSERFARYSASAVDLLQFRDRPGSTLPWSEWHDRVRELLSQAGRQPYPENEPLRGSRALPALKAPVVTYAAIYGFRTVEDARRDWDQVRQRLERVRDLSWALGLAGDSSPELAPLKLPVGFAIDQVSPRLAQLKKAYPKYADWSLQEVSEPAASDVRIAARTSYQRLMEAGRQVVLRELANISSDGRETLERWKVVARWLPDAPELRDWGQLVKILQRLTGEPLSDPTLALATFVQQPNFTLKFNTVRVAIPDDVSDNRLRPVGRLTITHGTAGGPVQMQFQRADEEVRDARRRSTTFTFTQEGSQTLTYVPGEDLYAELAVRDGDKEWRLRWQQSRSELWRFESLFRDARFYAPGSNPIDGALKEVRLSFTPETGVPHVPDLLPVVILKR